jgi:hypothetical protein
MFELPKPMGSEMKRSLEVKSADFEHRVELKKSNGCCAAKGFIFAHAWRIV